MIYRSDPCLNKTQWECINRPENDINESNEAECSKLCPLECETINYDIQSSFSWYPAKALRYFWLDKICQQTNISDLDCNPYNPNIDYNTFPQSFLAFNVFFPYLEYTQINASPKTSWFDLISQIGGSLGIFLGLSVFSFLEILEVIFIIFLKLFT